MHRIVHSERTDVYSMCWFSRRNLIRFFHILTAGTKSRTQYSVTIRILSFIYGSITSRYANIIYTTQGYERDLVQDVGLEAIKFTWGSHTWLIEPV